MSIDIIEIDENAVNPETMQEVADSIAAVNLDEMVPETLAVAFREFVPDKAHGYREEIVEKHIRTFVPMFLFNRMQYNQRQLQKQRKWLAAHPKPEPEDGPMPELLFEDNADDFKAFVDRAFDAIMQQGDPAFSWQAREVLSVWRMTPGERDMTLKRLVLGLGFEGVQRLFMVFFVETIRRKQSRA